MSTDPRRSSIAGAQAPNAGPQAPQRQPPAVAGGRRPQAAGAVLAVLLVLGGLGALIAHHRAAPSAPSAPTLAQLRAIDAVDRARLIRDGLPASGFGVRDWREIDGDGVRLNGVPVLVGAAPTPITAPPGVLAVSPILGTDGPASLEIAAPGQPPYRLLLEPGQAFTVIVR